ncbi:GTPase [Anaerosolibacter sp.]|uniref:GTPase n=1 Tax=Anaerosolibacter sp. TaxID=1872527 RepID=UPI0039EE655D
MKKCLIIGKPHVGKTLFFILFSKYLGLKELLVEQNLLNGDRIHKLYTFEEAIKSLCASKPFKTQYLQSIDLNLPLLKGNMKLQLVDGTGLTEGIHGDVSIRRGMVQTLAALYECDIILHMIDINSYAAEPNDTMNGFGCTDIQLTQYGLSHQAYVILANKIDLLDSRTKLAQLQLDYPQHTIIPISTLSGQGFNEIKAYCRFKSKYV